MMRTDLAAPLADAVRRIGDHSGFLRTLVSRRPDVVSALAEAGLEYVLQANLQPVDPANAAQQLRLQRQAVALATALADLSGAAALEDVMACLTRFADHALDAAIRAAILERTPNADPIGFAALALGKHGSRELNYSSDIDPILIFDPETLPRRPREEPVEAAVRIARRVIELLQTRDGDGYVFRVDLRLRPSPEATPLALPFDAALGYYESSALPWERAAFIRARAAAGDMAMGGRFLDAVQPFIWRRSLDFGAVGEVRGLSRRIRQHHAQGQRLGPGFDLKRGRGGIREVEFFAQIHQLIHGGREPALRAPATLDALAALRDAGRVDAGEANCLSGAYRLYRTIEHRLQMVDDLQTHRLPKQPAELDNVARLHGLPDGGALVDLLRPDIDSVGRIYDALDGEPSQHIPRDPDALEALLTDSGFVDAGAARTRIDQMRLGKSRSLRTPVAQAAFEAMMPTLIAELGRGPNPNEALNRFDALVGGLPSAINLFRLLHARPGLGRTLTNVLSHAPALSQALARRPALLDGLIDATALQPPPPLDELIREFAGLEANGDFELLLDRVRQRVGERRFALGVQLIEGVADPIDVAAGYARVAEAALNVLADATIAGFEATHGRVPGGELLVLALGRLGGGALTHASDLDLVYLFTGEILPESDGRRPLGATTYFNRLAQRVSAALSVPTASGPLYEIDTRLRPSGTQGLLAVSLASFDLYQRESAWTWEHMALTRARPIYGSADARVALSAIVDAALDRPRALDKLVADAAKMRGDIARHKRPAGRFDVKLIPGGLIDAEFTVHLLQLRHRTGFNPRLRAAVRTLADAGLIAESVIGAHELLTRMLVTLRLVSPSSDEPPDPSKPIVATACGQPDWPALVTAYDAARDIIAAEWARVSQ